jgi:hypothetical protein
MAGGAIVAAAAGARQRRIQDILDAFRAADATTPKRARSPAEIGARQNYEFQTLVDDGVLVPGPTTGTWYLSEETYVARQEARRRAAGRAVIVVITLVIVALIAVFLVARIKGGGPRSS